VWASEGFYPGGGTRGLIKNVGREEVKVVKFSFSHRKLGK